MPAREPQSGKIRYAVVGLGHISQTAVLPAFEHAAENSELVALISNDQRKLQVLADKYGATRTHDYAGFDACMRSGEVDAVYIALPNHLHCEYAMRAAEAGVHVLCEKPLAPSEDDCAAMIRAADENDVKLMTAYRLHFDEANLATAELVRSGKLGKPRSFHSVFTINVRDPKNIRLSPIEQGGGTLFDLGVYCINAARHVFDAEPIEVLATSVTNSEPRFARCDEMTSAVLRFPGDRLASFTTSFGAADVSEYRVVCSDGWVRLDPAYEYAEPLRQECLIDGERAQRSFAKCDQFAPELVYFSNSILRNEECEPSGWEGLADVRVVCALYESARTAQPVLLAPFEHECRKPSLDHAMHKPPLHKAPEEIHAQGPSGR